MTKGLLLAIVAPVLMLSTDACAQSVDKTGRLCGLVRSARELADSTAIFVKDQANQHLQAALDAKSAAALYKGTDAARYAQAVEDERENEAKVNGEVGAHLVAVSGKFSDEYDELCPSR